jgi:hypothetical protein
MRRMMLGLLVLASLTMVAPAAAGASATEGPRTVDQLATALAEDPIIVEPALGAGFTDDVHDVLTDLAAEVDVPVFVVLASVPPDLRSAEDPAQQAAAVLSATLGDGLYHVAFTTGGSWTGGFGSARTIDVNPGRQAVGRIRGLRSSDHDQTTSALEAELVVRSAADPGRSFSDDELKEWIDTPWAFVPTEARDRTDRIAQRWVTTIAVAVSVLVAGLILTPVIVANPLTSGRARQGRTPGRRPPPVMAPDPADLSRAQQRYDRLRASDLASPHATSAAEAIEAARLVADTGDDLDAVGAWVLALQARRELDRIRRPTRDPYRPCVVNPLHGEASRTVALAGSSIDAPACAACGDGAGGEFLVDSTWRGARPYLETSSVWARTGFGALVDDLARQVIADRRKR